jgi:hypothetical protein
MNKLFLKNAILAPALALVLVAIHGCKKSSLDLVNPNEPGTSAISTEAGMKRFALGIYNKPGLELWWLAMANHDIMGDSYYIPWGNFGWRWVNQATQIVQSDGTVLNPPQGGAQLTQLKNFNTRAFGDNNAFVHEWRACYFVNNQANIILANVDNITFSGDAAIKKKALKAWAYWWKGYAYSRIGSIYIAGLINENPNEFTSDFLSADRLRQEGNANFDKAIAELTGIAENDANYLDIISGCIPDFTKKGNGGNLTPQMFVRNINTYKARNVLVSKAPSALTATEWNNIITLCTNGIRSTDKILTMRSNSENDFVGQTGWASHRLLIGWFFISERLVQDFQPGDARFTRNVVALATPRVNDAGRGFLFGTRWNLKDVSQGGDWASTTLNLAEQPVACSYEENELMLAEAKIYTANISGGVGHINTVRTHQKSELPALAGSISQAEALAQLRSERRIALFLKNVSFYDARRWGVTKPVSQGGGRMKGVISLAGRIDSATINYNYADYWDVPANELDFNLPSSVSVPVANPN